VKVGPEQLASPEEVAAITVALEALVGAGGEMEPERAPRSRWRFAARVVDDEYDAARNRRPPRLRN
jgi:hypothetical protein